MPAMVLHQFGANGEGSQTKSSKAWPNLQRADSGSPVKVIVSFLCFDLCLLFFLFLIERYDG